MKKARSLIKLQKNIKILDIGGRALNGETDRSYRSIFEDILSEYYVADIESGFNVTHIMPGPYELPFDDNTIDLIVSGQTLEHVKNPFKSVAEMRRVLKDSGYMILIAPSTGKRHDLIDCWRFMDDSFKSIAEENEITVIADWIDKSAPDERSRQWSDHIFVGQK
jgi:ubiquinone/menaquinone biosynthesis C-methylase UbiE